MKLNNKGFAISTIMYMILVLAIILIVLVLSILTSRQIMLDSVKKDVLSDIYGSNSTKSPSFAGDPWPIIVANVKAGNIDIYKDDIGEEKEIVLNGGEFNNQSFTVRLANISNNEDEGCGDEGFSETACGFVVEFVDIINTQKMNLNATNEGGWPNSELYKYLTGTIYNALPDELKSGIKDTKVISGHGNTSTETTNFESTDKIYLLSPHEVWENGSSNQINYDTAWNNTRQLDYYKGQNVTTDSYGGAIKKNTSNSASYWWLRSAYSSNSYDFDRVNIAGSNDYIGAIYAYGVAPAFRIG